MKEAMRKIINKKEFETLVLNNEVDITINNSNYKNLLNKLYNVVDSKGKVRTGKIITVHPYDLTSSSRTEVSVCCSVCHDITIMNLQRTWNNIVKNKGTYICKNCIRQDISEHKSNIYLGSTVKFVRDYSDLKYLGYFRKDYGGKDRLFLILECEKHGVFEQFADSIHANILCPKCGRERTGKKLRSSKSKKVKALRRIFPDEDADLLSDKFRGTTDKKTIACPYCGRDWTISLVNMNYRDTEGCQKCCGDRHSLSNSSNWQGGRTKIFAYLRGGTKDWNFRSRFFYNNTCIITGEKDTNIHVHHLDHDFFEIANNVFNSLGIEILENVSKYTQEQLNILRKSINEAHEDISLGVCLSADIHYDFHSKKGFKNTDSQDFLDYVYEFYPKSFDRVANIILQ